MPLTNYIEKKQLNVPLNNPSYPIICLIGEVKAGSFEGINCIKSMLSSEEQAQLFIKGLSKNPLTK